MSTGLRIAIAASGLSHIVRGVEAWALETAASLERAGEDVTLFQGSGAIQSPRRETLGCILRSDPRAIKWANVSRNAGLWRLGVGSPYDVEQLTFTRGLWKRIRRDFDILHVQDPMLAMWMTWLHKAGLSRPVVILGHGTEESPRILRRFEVLQHLSPVYLADWEAHRPPKQAVFAIPNFIDVQHFRPGDKLAARAAWDIPSDAFVVLCVAAVKKTHKRVDYLIREFEEFSKEFPRRSLLVVAGARETETEEILALGRELLGDRVKFLIDVPREKIASLYHTADVFALMSLHEMQGIALVEAMASGLPVCCNAVPILEWVAGESAQPTRLDQPGGFLCQLRGLMAPGEIERRGLLARQRAVELFSEAAVIPQFQEMYRSVAQSN